MSGLVHTVTTTAANAHDVTQDRRMGASGHHGPEALRLSVKRMVMKLGASGYTAKDKKRPTREDWP